MLVAHSKGLSHRKGIYPRISAHAYWFWDIRIIWQEKKKTRNLNDNKIRSKIFSSTQNGVGGPGWGRGWGPLSPSPLLSEKSAFQIPTFDHHRRTWLKPLLSNPLSIWRPPVRMLSEMTLNHLVISGSYAVLKTQQVSHPLTFVLTCI